MLTSKSRPSELDSGMTRRDLLRAGGGGAVALTSFDWSRTMASPVKSDRAVILLMLVGGPSQLETWDPKPDAIAEVRGPFGSIPTTVPGIRINEHLPRVARRMNRLTLIRSMYHEAAPIHETGHQLIQTGRLSRDGVAYPHVGAVAARLMRPKAGVPSFAVVPGPIGHTGVNLSHGQSAGALGLPLEPTFIDPGGRSDERPSIVEAYGPTSFGRSCLLSRQLVESGSRMVTVNMYETVFNRVSWDCHGARPFSTLDDYAREVLPSFDLAFSALLDDLDQRGLLETTLVVATGEFGRTPRLNLSGGRDHWPGVWSAVVAGGGTRGGQVIGASDANATAPADRPVQPAELVATMYGHLGIDPGMKLNLGQGEAVALVEDARPIAEAFV